MQPNSIASILVVRDGLPRARGSRKVSTKFWISMDSGVRREWEGLENADLGGL